jgi:hypothetical protein
MNDPMQNIYAIPANKAEFDQTVQEIRDTFFQHLPADRQDLIECLPFPESQIYRRINTSCPVLWLAPHGFFGDALHTDYVAAIAAEMMAGSCLVNNKKFRCPLPEPGYGEIANLNNPDDPGSHSRFFVNKLISAISIIRLKSNQNPYIVFLLNTPETTESHIKITYATSDEHHDCPSSQWITRLKQALSTDQHNIDFCEKKCPAYEYTLFSHLYQKQMDIGPLQLIQIQLKCSDMLSPKTILPLSSFLSQVLSYTIQTEQIQKEVVLNNKETELIEIEADMRLVEQAGMKLTEILSRHYENAMIEAGKYLVQMFFDNDIERARQKKPVKEKSLYQLILYLQRQKNNAPSKSWIYNAVNLAVDYSDFKHFHMYGKLLLSHKILLLPIDNHDKKKDLIQEIAKNKLTVSQLKDRLDEVRNDSTIKKIHIKKKTRKISENNPPRLLKKAEKEGKVLSKKILEAVEQPTQLFKPDIRQHFNRDSLSGISSGKRRQILRKLQKKHKGILSDIKQLKTLIQENENYLQHYQTLMVEMENSLKQ